MREKRTEASGKINVNEKTRQRREVI